MLSLRLAVRNSLRPELKLTLRQLLRLELRDPFSGPAAKGIEGMLAADAVLKERNVAGVLVGGLARAVWNYRNTPDVLAEHKDVDVAVLSGTDLEPFEKGVDWWMPGTAHLTIRGDYSTTDEHVRYWQNGNGVVLRYDLNPYDAAPRLPPGLHLPERTAVLQILLSERLSTIHEAVDASDAYDALWERIDRTIGKRLTAAARGFPLATDLHVREHPARKYATLLDALENTGDWRDVLTENDTVIGRATSEAQCR